jgi:hypothetical protein
MARQIWAEADLALLRSLYSSRPTTEIAPRLNRTVHKVYAKAAALGLKKSPAFFESEESGRLRKGQTRPGTERTQFPKGHVPANKGLRRPGWFAGRMRETQFQKGARSGKAAKNWRPIGTVQPDSGGYLRIKVREAVYGAEPTGFGNSRVWPMYNRYVWEQHNGLIPPKHLVVFRDRDRGNCSIENLELISMAENVRRNRMWGRLPRELAEAIQLNGALKRQIRRLDGKEQDHGSSGSPV